MPASVKFQYGEERHDALRLWQVLISALKDRNFKPLKKLDPITTRWNTLRSHLETIRTCTEPERAKELASSFRKVILQMPYPELSSEDEDYTTEKEVG